MPKDEPIKLDFGKFFEAFRGESDRAAAVLGAAYIETRLKNLFRARLVSNVPKELFEFRGPLGDFSSKIDLAFALGWVSAETRNDLHIIRRIRNEFAHDVDHTLSFAIPSISDRTRHFSSLPQLRSLIEHTDSEPEGHSAGTEKLLNEMFGTGRKRFETALSWLEMAISDPRGKNHRATEHKDQWRILELGPVTLEPGETAVIDLESGTTQKDPGG